MKKVLKVKKCKTALVCGMSLLLCTGTAMAQTTVGGFSTQNGKVLLSGTSSPDVNVNFLILNDDAQTSGEKIFLVQDTVSNGEGVWSVLFGIDHSRLEAGSDNENVADLTVYVRADDDSAPTTIPFKAFTENGKNNAVEILCESTSADEICTLLTNSEHKEPLMLIGLDMNNFSVLNELEIQKFVEIFMQNEKRGNSLADMVSAFNQTVVFRAIGNSKVDAIDILKSNAEWLSLIGAGMSMDEIISDTAMFSWTAAYVANTAPFETKEALEKEFTRGAAYYKLKQADYSQIGSLLTSYASDMEITNNENYAYYLSASSGSKVKFSKSLVDSFAQNNALTPELFSSYLAAARSAAASAPPAGGAVGGGSGGGGGGGSIRMNSSSGASQSAPVINQESLYSDIDSVSWAKTAIERMSQQGIINGYTDKTFRPHDSVSREEFVKMLILTCNKLSQTAKCHFADVPENAWYYSYVASAYEYEIVKGISDTEFGTGVYITREAMCTMVYNALVKSEKIPADIREYKSFDDENNISVYAKEAVKALYQKGILNGVSESEIAPKKTTTRAEAAVLLEKLL